MSRLDEVCAGRFVLRSEHRRGGMGTIWCGHDLVEDRPVAVKLLHAGGPVHVERFARESRLLADLNDPRIVSYVAHGTTDDGVPYLVMNWLDGESLSERLARCPLTLDECLTLARATAGSLAVAHRQGIVHRDLKPSNLLLRANAIDDVVVLDLGLARHVTSADALTQAGTILGTPSYMAPEQAQGQADIGASADVFSLGCLLFECLTGAPPFVGQAVLTVLAKVLFQEAPRLRDMLPAAPAGLETLIQQMLAKQAGSRPRDGAAVLAALDAIDVSLLVEPDTAPTVPDLARPKARAPSGEQALMSIVLATPETSVATGSNAHDEKVMAALDGLAVYRGDHRQLADGTLLVAFSQQRGAATDLAVRAARCALHLHTLLPAWTIVIGTGRAVAEGQVHVGEVVDRAESMLRLATDEVGGAIRADEVTAGLLGARFQTSAWPDGSFRLDGEELTIDPSRPLLGRPTACVGRDTELATLELALRACVEQQQPHAVLVVGPPGMGKSRLRHELVRRVQVGDQAFTVLLGLGDPVRASSASGLLGGAVARLCGVRTDATLEENRALLQSRISLHLPEGDEGRRTVALIGELCGVRFPDDAVPELRLARQDPHLMASLLSAAWVAFLRAEAAHQPVLLALDDLQWSDPLSVNLVEKALRALNTAPLMVLALARPEISELFPDLWAQGVTVMRLRGLSAAVTTRFVRQVLGTGVDESTVARIVTQAGGNALFLEELIRAADARSASAPQTVLAMLQARIGALPASERRVLRAASVFGESFPLAGLEAVLDDGPGTTLPDVLAMLARHEIVAPQGPEDSADRWRFRHVLMRDAAYGLHTEVDRTVAHARAGRFLADLGEADAVVAAHFELGGDTEQAVAHYLAAADHAYRANDLGATVALVQRGLDAGAVGESRGILHSIAAPARFYRAEVAACWDDSTATLALLPSGHPRRSSGLAWRACAAVHLGKQYDIEDELHELLTSEPDDRDVVDYGVALGHALIGHTAGANLPQARRILERLIEIDARVGKESPLVRGHLHFGRAWYLLFYGEDPYTPWHLMQLAAECHGSLEYYLQIYSRAETACCAARFLPLEDCLVAMREVVRSVQGMRAIEVVYVSQLVANCLLSEGDLEHQGEAHTLALAAAQTGEMNAYRCIGVVSLARAYLRAGDLDRAEAHAREACTMLRGMGMRAYYAHADAVLLGVLLHRQDGGAAALADEALRTVEDVGIAGFSEIPLRLAVAEAHLAVGRRAAATRGVERALAGLGRRVATIPDASQRARYLGLREHARLLELAGELGLSGLADRGVDQDS